MERARDSLPAIDADGASDVSECDDAGPCQRATDLGDMAQVSVPTRMHALSLCGVLVLMNSTTMFLDLLPALLAFVQSLCTHQSLLHSISSEPVPLPRAE